MASYSSQGLVLKKTKLGETDLIITLLGEGGHQIRAVAKGARKPTVRSSAQLELFSVVDLLLHEGRSLDVISEVRLVEPRADCRSTPERLAAAAVLCEFIEIVTRESDVEPRLYQMTLEALRCMGIIVEDGLEFLCAAALIKSAAQIGYAPSFFECALCGTQIEAQDTEFYACSVESGGVICDECLSENTESSYEPDVSYREMSEEYGGISHDNSMRLKRISYAHLAWLRLCMGARFSQITDFAAENPRGFHEVGSGILLLAQEWIQVHLDIRLKSARLLRDFLQE